MNQVIEQLVTKKLPLEKSHEQLGASFGEQDGWLLPKSYGDVAAEYKAVRENAGLLDLSPRGRVRVSGSEAIMFLNGLITNDMKTLAENHWMSAVFPNVQGRIIAAVRVVRLADEATRSAIPSFLLDTEAPTHARLLKTIERFTMAGDFRVNDITNDTALLSIQGINAAAIATKVLGATVAELPRDGGSEIGWEQSSVIVMRATHTSEDGFDLIVDSAHAAALWQALSEAGAKPVGYDALETLRIEAGIGRYGRDMDETNVVTEANLDDAVSYTKGCYIGQEIIARIKYRGHVAKKLTGLLFEREEQIDDGPAVVRSSEGKEIGRVTSAAVSSRLGRTVALGYVRYEQLAPGPVVSVASNNKG